VHYVGAMSLRPSSQIANWRMVSSIFRVFVPVSLDTIILTQLMLERLFTLESRYEGLSSCIGFIAPPPGQTHPSVGV
jgi:hypothetical protein